MVWIIDGLETMKSRIVQVRALFEVRIVKNLKKYKTMSPHPPRSESRRILPHTHIQIKCLLLVWMKYFDPTPQSSLVDSHFEPRVDSHSLTAILQNSHKKWILLIIN